MQNEIKYFSMFTGVGGFEVGLERSRNNRRLLQCETSEDLQDGKSYIEERQTGFTCIGMSEIDKHSSQVLARRFPNIKNWGDCTKIRPEDLPDFDMLCGGFPCQAFSIAGKRRGFEDIRGTMFFEVERILKIKRPKIILLENVKGLLNHAKGETYSVILQTLDELGYEVQWMVLNSKFFGVPQNRERVFIIGNLRRERRSEILPFGCDVSETSIKNKEQGILLSAKTGARRVKQSNCLDTMYHKGLGSKQERPAVVEIKQLNNPIHSNNRVYGEKGINLSLKGNRQPKIRAVLTPERSEKRQNGRRFKEDGEPSFTLTGQDIHEVTDGFKIRRLTPVECCRLQGFPDNWNEYGIDDKGEKVKMSDTQRYKQMGNAVTTNVIAAIGFKILLCTNEINENGRVTTHI